MNKIFIATLFLISNIYPAPDDSLHVVSLKAIEMQENDDNGFPITPGLMRGWEEDLDDLDESDLFNNLRGCCTLCTMVIEPCMKRYIQTDYNSLDFVLSKPDISGWEMLEGAICSAGVFMLLSNPPVQNKVNQGCDALARLLHIKSE